MIQRTEKQCFKCGVVKPIAEFYVHRMMGDGHLGKCKDCTRRDVNEHRAKNIDRIQGYDRVRAKLPHRISANRERSKELKKRHGADYDRAHNAVTRAVKSGQMTRPNACSKCGAACAAEAHHDDHSRPLDVLWLCRSCHCKRHVELKRLRAMANAYGSSPQPF